MAAIEQAPGSVLELRGVRKHYGRHTAVDALDLSLRTHEFLTFLGPSGSGKTTTLMMVAGLQRPDAGSIVLNGQPVDRLPSYRRDIGMVFQHYALFPHMTVRRNISFPLEMRRLARAEADRLVADALHLVGLSELGDRLPRQLSGGQQQRVALARALVYSPALLLMDEPLGALDKKLREQLQIEIKRVHRERRMSVLYVTHDQEEALTMSDRIAVFNKGRVEQVGTPEELYERPATRFVAGFIGETNFLSGRALAVDDRMCQVEVMGVKLFATARGAIAPGAKVDVAIRPERVRISAVTIGAAGFTGELVDVIYLGNARKYVVRLPSGQECVALQDANSAEASGLHRGGIALLSWAAEHATAFPAPDIAG
jgi:putative spermidine/putrescine transport system ATP-binding protein